jgi:hypothetical protein
MPNYNAAIPQPGDLLSQSQADILNNFDAINTFVAVNHEALNSVAPHAEGKHRQIEMPVQAAVVGTDVTQWAMKVVNNTLVAPAPAIWLTPPVSAQHPAGTAYDITTALFADPGWCRLPCGIIVKWGTSAAVHGTGGGNIIQLSAAPAPAINTVLAVMLTPTDSDNQSIVTYSGFTVATQRVTWTYGRSFAPGGGTNAVCKCLVLGI